MDGIIWENIGKLAADLVLLVHACWVIFLLCGAFIPGERAWIRGLHLAGLALNAAMDLTGLDCPLTVLERALRLRFDPQGWYAGSFLQHYLGSGLGLTLSAEPLRWLGIGLLVATWGLYRSRARAVAGLGEKASGGATRPVATADTIPPDGGRLGSN
jgi:hypothetical protein